ETRNPSRPIRREDCSGRVRAMNWANVTSHTQLSRYQSTKSRQMYVDNINLFGFLKRSRRGTYGLQSNAVYFWTIKIKIM
ncbi:hypothetical protein J6590_088467, partial [Homalodisca vitripennis]